MVTDFRITVPPTLVDRLTSGVVPPTAALKSVAEVESATNAKPPSTVPVNVIAPLPVERVASAASVVAPATLNAALVVV